MHELTITENILKVILPAAEDAGAKKILEVRMNIGEVSGVVPSYLEKAWAELTKGTMAEDSKLIFHMSPAIVRCSDCGTEGECNKENFSCKKCGSLNVKVVQGREYFIEDLKVE